MSYGNGVLEAIDKLDSLRARSSLAIWMRENHDAFADRLSKKLPDWTVLARLFGEAGLTDRYGHPPKAETARKTWQRVRKEVREVRACYGAASRTGSVRNRSPSTVASSGPFVASTDEDPADDPPPRFTFRASKPR